MSDVVCQARDTALSRGNAVGVTPIIATMAPEGEMLVRLLLALVVVRIARHAGYLVKYQSSGFMKPNALAA